MRTTYSSETENRHYKMILILNYRPFHQLSLKNGNSLFLDSAVVLPEVTLCEKTLLHLVAKKVTLKPER